MTSTVKIVKSVRAKKGTEEIIDPTDFSEWLEDNFHGVGYEIIDGACVPYYDGDFDYPDMRAGAGRTNQDVDKCVNAVSDIFPKGNLKVFTANGIKNTTKGQVWRNSIHIIVRNAGYFSKANQIPKVDFMDPAVYNSYQKFRLPYMVKNVNTDNRPFELITKQCGTWVKTHRPEDAVDDPNVWLCSWVEGETRLEGAAELKKIKAGEDRAGNKWFEKAKRHMPTVFDAFEYRDSKVDADGNILITSTRLKPSECFNDGCVDTHDNDNTLMLIVNEKSNTISIACRRYPKVLKKVCKCVDPSFIEKAMALIVVLASIPVKKSKCITLKGIYKTIGSAWWVINPFTTKSVHHDGIDTLGGTQACEKYCADIVQLVADINNPLKRLVCIKACMGTGKTYLMIKVLTKMILENPEMFVVNTTFRVSLAEYLQKEYEHLGFKNYKDRDSVANHKICNDIKRIILQLDSFNRLDWKKVKPDMVIIDEVSQQRRHMGSETYLKSENRTINNARFKWSVRHAKKVIIMDAGLTHMDVEWVESLMYEKGEVRGATIIHWNTYKPMTGKDIEATANTPLVIDTAKKAINDGKRVFIGLNIGKTKVMAIGTYLRKALPDKKILVICSLTQNQTAVKLALADPNTEFGKYDAVIVSPSLQSGVSYAGEDFDECFGIFDNRTTMSSDALQQLRRVRKFKNSKYLVSLNQSNTRPFKDITRMIDEKRIAWKHLYFECEHLTKYCGIETNEDGFNMVISNDFTRQVLKNREEQDYDRINFVRNFAIHAHNEGFGIKQHVSGMTPEEESTLSKAVSKAVKLCEEENQDAINEAMVKAELVSTEIMLELKKRMDSGVLTENEKIQFDKKVLNEFYRVDVETDSDWTKTYNVPKVKNHYTNQRRMAKMENMDDSITDLARAEKNFMESERSKHTGDLSEAMRVLTFNTKYQLFNFINISMLKLFGFNGLWDTTKKTEEEIKVSAQKFKTTYLNADEFNRTVVLLEKKAWKVKKMDTFKQIMDFINGVLRKEFGVTVKRVTPGGTAKDTSYHLKNEYISKGLFVNKWLVPEGLGDTVPAYGGKTIEPIVTDVDIDDEDDEDEEIENEFTTAEINRMMGIVSK